MKSLTIGKKLYLSLGAMMALVVTVCAVALEGTGSLAKDLDHVVRVNAKRRYLASSLNTLVSDFTAEERGIIVRSFMKDAEAASKFNAEFGSSETQFKKLIDELTPLIELPEGRRMLAEIQTYAGYVMQYHEELYRLAASGQIDQAAAVLKDKSFPMAVRCKASAVEFVALQNRIMASTMSAADTSVSRTNAITISMLGLSLLLCVGVVYVVRQISQKLRQAVTEIGEGAEQTASAARQVSSSSQSLAQGSSEQAASLQETSASSEEINSMARKNTENSRLATDLVTQSQQKFIQTNEALEQTVAAMSEINAQSGKISKIIKVIDEIAFQTNILALNAAVEAARAGEAGMGFAVVADEVRSLAQRCAQAAKDTAELIEESIAKSNDGKTKVDEVAEAIRGITEQSAKVRTLVDEVNVGSQEQARGIAQISQAITQMEQVTQRTAANAEESASAAEELNAQSETLKDIVERLTAMVGGDETASHRVKTASRAYLPAAPRARSAASSLTSLHAAVGTVSKAHTVSKVQNAKDVFPLEEEFKEF